MNPELVNVPIESVEVGPQPRTNFDADSIEKLAQSIERTGLQQPLLCVRTKKGVRLIDGERRLRALKSLGRTEVQVLVLPDDLADGPAWPPRPERPTPRERRRPSGRRFVGGR